MYADILVAIKQAFGEREPGNSSPSRPPWELVGLTRYILTETMETRPGALKKKGGLTKMCPTPPCLYFSPALAFFLHIPACKVFISSCIVFSQGEKGDQGKDCEGGDIKVCKRVHNAYIIASRS